MVLEAPLEQNDNGLVPRGPGWFVLNARGAQWAQGEDVSASCEFEGEHEFDQVGIFLRMLRPGEPVAMYHWEADQEGFLVLSGEALLLVEGDERALRRWDFFHCPPGTKHIVVGAGDGPCVLLSLGAPAREHQSGEGWGGYPVDEVARRYGAGVEEETTDASQAYARFPRRQLGAYREGWLPG
jgi:uncharacterized cupin superfamily protein